MPLMRVAGVQVSVDWTWLLALGYVIVVMVGDYQDLLGPAQRNQAFLYGVGLALAFFASIVLHEFGHAVVARRNGIGILGIDLWLLGGLAKMDREPETPGVEFRVAAAGPAVTLVLALGLLGGAKLLMDPGSDLKPLTVTAGDDPLVFALTTLGWVNLFLLGFNLVPAYPLDGGRIARAIAWAYLDDRRRATLITATLGRWFGFGLIALGIFWLASGSPLGGAIFIFMGFTISQSARGATIQESVFGEAQNLTVADVMDRQPVVMPADASVQRALDEYFWRYRWPWFPVVDRDGRFVGLIEQNAVERVDERDRAGRHAGELVVPSSQRMSVRDDTPLTALLANQEIREHGSLMAVDGEGQLIGVVTIEQVQRGLRDAIERATRREPEPPSDL